MKLKTIFKVIGSFFLVLFGINFFKQLGKKNKTIQENEVIKDENEKIEKRKESMQGLAEKFGGTPLIILFLLLPMLLFGQYTNFNYQTGTSYVFPSIYNYVSYQHATITNLQFITNSQRIIIKEYKKEIEAIKPSWFKTTWEKFDLEIGIGFGAFLMYLAVETAGNLYK